MREGDDLGTAVQPVLPYGLAPAANHGVAFGSRRSRENVADPNDGSLLRDRRRDPSTPVTRQLHVRMLHLPAGEVLFQR